MPLFDGFKNSALIQKTALELKQLQVERDKAIAELATKLAVMRSNLMYLDEQIDENSTAIKELTDKENSTHKLVNKRLASPIEENNAKVELLNQKIELSKNSITQIAITRGIQILTEEE
jgi:outer membrane protein TolC